MALSGPLIPVLTVSRYRNIPLINFVRDSYLSTFFTPPLAAFVLCAVGFVRRLITAISTE